MREKAEALTFGSAVALTALIGFMAVTAAGQTADHRDDMERRNEIAAQRILRISPAKDANDPDGASPETYVIETSSARDRPPGEPGVQEDPQRGGSVDRALRAMGGSEYFFTGGEVASSPKPIDLDGDPRPAIVIGTSLGLIYVLTADGIVAPGWPVASGSAVGYSSAAVADLDGDDSEDIIFHSNSSLEAYAQDGTILSGWPQPLDSNIGGNEVICSPVVADIDNDGDPEVMVGHFQHMYAFHHDGTPVAGWPISQAHPFGPLYSTPAVGDLDGDGDAEICFKVYGGNGDPADIYLLHHDGTHVAGWPKLGLDRSHLSSPVFADIDDDGSLDIVVSLHFFTDGNYVRLYVWKLDGSDVSGFPVAGSWNTTPVNNSVGDVDGDGFLEIFVGSAHYTSPHYAVHAWNHDGSTLSGSWPRSAPLCHLNGSPALADVNGGFNEVVIGVGGCYVDDNGVMNVWANDGSPLPTWPRSVSGKLRSSALVMDSNHDGTPEIYVGSSNGWIHRFLTEDATGGSDPEWNQIFGNPRNTNCYCPFEPTSVTDHDEKAAPERFALAMLRPNPFRFGTTIRYDIPLPGGDVRISVYSVRGRRVVDLLQSFQPAGRHVVTWKGLDASGRQVCAGAYFVRLEAPTHAETRRIMVLK